MLQNLKLPNAHAALKFIMRGILVRHNTTGVELQALRPVVVMNKAIKVSVSLSLSLSISLLSLPRLGPT